MLYKSQGVAGKPAAAIDPRVDYLYAYVRVTESDTSRAKIGCSLFKLYHQGIYTYINWELGKFDSKKCHE